MTETTDVYPQWDLLCKEFEDRRDDYDQALAVVNHKFWGDGNPTEEESTALEERWEEWQDVQRRLQEFAKKHVK